MQSMQLSEDELNILRFLRKSPYSESLFEIANNVGLKLDCAKTLYLSYKH